MTISPTQIQGQNNPFYQVNNQFGYGNQDANIFENSGFGQEQIDFLQLNQRLNQQVTFNNPNSGSIFAPSGPSYVVTPNLQDIIPPQDSNAPAQQAESDSKDDLGVMGGIGRIAASPLKFAWEVIKSGGKYIKNVFCGAWRATGGAIGTLLSGHPIDAIGEFFGGCWDVIKSPFELLWDVGSDCVNFVGDIFGGVGNILEGCWDGVCSFFKGIFS